MYINDSPWADTLSWWLSLCVSMTRPESCMLAYGCRREEMQRYGISVLGVGEMRWDSCGRLRIVIGETVLYSGMDEGENHREEVASFCLKRLHNACWSENLCLRG